MATCGGFEARAEEICAAARQRYALTMTDRPDTNRDTDRDSAMAVVLTQAQKKSGCKMPLGAVGVAFLIINAPSTCDRFQQDARQHGTIIAWKNRFLVTIRAAFRGGLADVLMACLDEVIEEGLKHFGQELFARFVLTTASACFVSTTVKIATYLYHKYRGNPDTRLPTPGELIRDVLTNVAFSALATILSPGAYFVLGLFGCWITYSWLRMGLADNSQFIKSSWSDVWQGFLCAIGRRPVNAGPRSWNVPDTFDLPLSLCCPITASLLVDPVTLHGFVYERAAIQEWVARNGTHPETRRQCFLEEICTSPGFRRLIQEYANTNGLALV